MFPRDAAAPLWQDLLLVCAVPCAGAVIVFILVAVAGAAF